MDDRPQYRQSVEQPTAVRRATVAQPDLTAWFAKAYGEIAAYLGAHGLAPKGFPFARYHLRADGRFDVEAGFPLDRPIAGNARVLPSTLPGGSQVVLWYIGPYDQIGKAHAVLQEWIAYHGGRPAGDSREIYHDPPTGDPTHWRTEIVQPYTPAQNEGDPR